MKKYGLTILAFVGLFAIAVMADNIVRPNTAGDALGTSTTPFGVAHIKTFGMSISGQTFVASIQTAPTSTAAVVDGYFVLNGPDSTTHYMMQKGTWTNGQGAVTFGTAYKMSTTPIVFMNWTETIANVPNGTNTSFGISGIASNGFTPTVLIPVPYLITNANWIAIGTAP